MGLASVGGTGGGQYKNLVPPLTSVSQNGYTVSATSVYPHQTPNDVVICFDGKTNDVSWSPGSDKIFLNKQYTNQTITVELPQAKNVRMVVIVYPSVASFGVGKAKTVSVSGSNDGIDYTPLTGAAATPSVFMRNDADTVKYRYYKIYMTRENEYIGIIEIMLFGK